MIVQSVEIRVVNNSPSCAFDPAFLHTALHVHHQPTHVHHVRHDTQLDQCLTEVETARAQKAALDTALAVQVS